MDAATSSNKWSHAAINPVTWSEIYVTDLERATKFYEAVLGVKLSLLGDPDSNEMNMMAFPMEMKALGAGSALVKMDNCPPGRGGTRIYFGSDDVAIEAARSQAAGGQLIQDKMPIGEYGAIALGMDTEGNMFGLHNAPAGTACSD